MRARRPGPGRLDARHARSLAADAVAVEPDPRGSGRAARRGGQLGPAAVIHPRRPGHRAPRAGVDLVPVVFVVDGQRLVVPIDRVKPKSGRRLQRLVNLDADARCTPAGRPLRRRLVAALVGPGARRGDRASDPAGGAGGPRRRLSRLTARRRHRPAHRHRRATSRAEVEQRPARAARPRHADSPCQGATSSVGGCRSTPTCRRGSSPSCGRSASGCPRPTRRRRGWARGGGSASDLRPRAHGRGRRRTPPTPGRRRRRAHHRGDVPLLRARARDAPVGRPPVLLRRVGPRRRRHGARRPAPTGPRSRSCSPRATACSPPRSWWRWSTDRTD